MNAFAQKILLVSQVFKPANMAGGYGEISPAITPFTDTNIDKVKRQVREMEKVLVQTYQSAP